ncbi:MAG: hypothetical protein HYU52_08020 [Acidobacteria bacterium]|nr:hypothetical protein [Acidobacteriota bacterium]
MNEAPELNARMLIDRMERGELPRDFTMFAAQGMLPLPQDDLIAVLAHLSTNSDTEVAALSTKSLREIPPRTVAAFCGSELADEASLDAIATKSGDPAILEAVVRSRGVSDATIERLARAVQPGIQEIIIVNQERIIRRPGILDALLENPAITPDVRRRVGEAREEFFEKKARRALSAEAVAALEIEESIDIGPVADLLDEAESEPQPENTLSPLEGDAGDSDKLSVWSMIAEMTVGERVQAAYKGGKTVRGILVRDRNKLVCTAVLKSPRITESEIEAFAAMRNLDEAVLRLIGTKREFLSKYVTVHNLVKNPKTPAGIALNLTGRLTSKDLKQLSTSKEVAEVIRVHARKLLQAKERH